MKKLTFLLSIAFLFTFAGSAGASPAGRIDKTVRKIAKKITYGLKSSEETVVIPHLFTLDEKNTLLGKLISQKLINQIARTDVLQPLERDFIFKLTEELKLGMTGLIDPETIQEVGQFFGADYVLVGTIQKIGKKIQFNVRLVRTETGKIVNATEISMRSSPDILALLDNEIRVRSTSEDADVSTPDPDVAKPSPGQESDEDLKKRMSRYFHDREYVNPRTQGARQRQGEEESEPLVLTQEYYESIYGKHEHRPAIHKIEKESRKKSDDAWYRKREKELKEVDRKIEKMGEIRREERSRERELKAKIEIERIKSRREWFNAMRKTITIYEPLNQK